MSVICILGEPEDEDMLWLAAALRRRGVDVDVVLPDELLGASITYRIETHRASASVRLRDDRSLDSTRVSLIINRLSDLPPLRSSSAADTAYLAEEWRAVLAGWMRAQDTPMLNPPRATSLEGPSFASVVWRAVAASNGMVCRPWRSDEIEPDAETFDVVCLGSRVFTSSSRVLSTELAGALAKTARSVGAPLFGATFSRIGDEWLLTDATARPRLARGGTRFVEAIIEYSAQTRGPT